MLFSDDSRFVSFAITQRKPRVRVIVPESERRRSGRERVAINYAEKYGLDDEEDRRGGEDDACGGVRPKETEIGAATDGTTRGAVSPWARARDSELGVTCHWCRQKTVETSTSSAPRRRARRSRAASSPSGMCLRNRHGEDVDAAVAQPVGSSNRCRGSCGVGCVTSAPAGPVARRTWPRADAPGAAGSRGRGGDNVHDYLVHDATGADPARAARRRSRGASTGGSGSPIFEPPAPATTRASEAAVTATLGDDVPRRRSARAVLASADVAAAQPLVHRAAEKDAACRCSRRAATPAPAKGAPVRARKRTLWRRRSGRWRRRRCHRCPRTSRPASRATPADDRPRRASLAALAVGRAPFGGRSSPTRRGAFAAAGKARAVASRQGDIRAMFAAREGARATRARAPREPRD